jgi:hypothetical protein
MAAEKGIRHGRPPQNDDHGTGRVLSKKWWLGIGAIVAIIGTIVTIFNASSATQYVRAKNGDCIIQGGNGNTCSADQVQPSQGASPPELTTTRSRLIDCQALTADAADESAELVDLKSAISVDDRTGRVTGHTATFGTSYSRTLALMQLTTARKARFESEGGSTRIDPNLDRDLNNMGDELLSLHEAVLDNGIGADQLNQLSGYSRDFSLLSDIKCAG